MIDSQNPEIDLLRLKEQISQDMSRGRLDDPGLSLSLDDSDIIGAYQRPVRATLPPYSPAAIQPAFVPNAAGRYNVHELMAFHDGAFISVAYASILGRPPDPDGFQHHLNNLHSGHSKAEILGVMRNSEEGRAKGVQVDGLRVRLLLARMFRLPVLGKLAQIAMAIWQLPTAQRNQRRFEDHMISVLGQVQENARAQSERLRLAVEALGSDQDAVFEQLGRRLARHRTRMELIRGAVSSGRAKVSMLERAAKLQQRALEDARKAAAIETGEEHLLDNFYADFEARFRGSREEIKKRHAVYLPFVVQAGAGVPDLPILDLGCGRGEWLELLSEQKLSARGIDLNRTFIKDNRARGFDVVEEDVLACLRGLKPNSIGAITSFHLIEHLPFKTLIAVLDEALRVLKPGGVVILETPNPSNLQVGACNFYIDPTHRNPIPHSLGAALLELRGFTGVAVKELHPYPQDQWVSGGGEQADATLNRILFGPQDYGVIGWKPTG